MAVVFHKEFSSHHQCPDLPPTLDTLLDLLQVQVIKLLVHGLNNLSWLPLKTDTLMD
jgi:hypothetical protein